MAILPRDSTATFDDTSEYFEDQYGDGVQCHQLSATENPYFSVRESVLTAKKMDDTGRVVIRDSLNHLRHQCDFGSRCELLAMSNSNFMVGENVLVWYHQNKLWHKGEIRAERSECYEIQFQYNGDGPRLRNWYTASCGLIQHDTPKVRDILKAHGVVLETKS